MILFDITQILYAIANLSYDALYAKESSSVCKKEPKTYVTIASLIPLYREPFNIIRNNVISQLNANYPEKKVNIFLIVEQKDEQTTENAQAVSKEFKNVYVIVVPPNGEKDWPEVIKKWKNNIAESWLLLLDFREPVKLQHSDTLKMQDITA